MDKSSGAHNFMDETELNSIFGTYSLDICAMTAGLLDELDFDENVNHRVGKLGPHVKLNSSSVLRLMIMRQICGKNPRGLSNMPNFAAKIPAPMLGLNNVDMGNIIECSNRYVCSDLLDRIADYGPSKFFSEMSQRVIESLSNDPIETVHLDSTSFHYHGVPKEEVIDNNDSCSKSEAYHADKSGLAIKHGYSRNGRPNDPQVNNLGLSARVKGLETPLPIYTATFNGNENDVARFQDFFKEDMEDLKKLYPSMKYIVADSAAATSGGIYACINSGLHLISRLPDSVVKQEYQDVLNKKIKLNELKVRDESEDGTQKELIVKYAWLGNHEVTEKERSKKIVCKKILFVAEANRAVKTSKIKKAAEKEKASLKAALNRLSEKPLNCKPDAERLVEEITKKTKFCNVIDVDYKETYSYSKLGRPAKGSVKDKLSIKVSSNVVIDEDKVQKAIERELFYVLFVTDTDRNWTAKEIYEIYHHQSDIEGLWKEVKVNGMFVDSIFLKSPKRIRALMAVTMLSLFIARVLLGKIREAMAARKIAFSTPSYRIVKKPSLQTIVDVFDTRSPVLLVTDNLVTIRGLTSKSLVYMIAEYLGEPYLKYYRSSFYNGHKFRLIEDCKFIQEMSSDARLLNELENEELYVFEYK